MNVKEGFWRTNSSSFEVLPCLAAEHRLGGSDPEKQCKEGHTGTLCAVCQDGYASTGSGMFLMCSACEGGDAATTIAVGFGAFFFILLLAMALTCCIRKKKKRRRENDDDDRAGLSNNDSLATNTNRVNKELSKIDIVLSFYSDARPYGKIMLSYLQIVGSLSFNLDIGFPPMFTTLMSMVSSVVNVEFLNMMPLGGVINSNFHHTLVVYTLVPFLTGIAMMIACWALISGLFEGRRFADPAADRFGARLGVLGIVAMVSGVLTRLMFTTQTEIDAGIPPAQFRVDVLWFVGVTVLATFVLGSTKFGSWIFAVGGNKQAARQIGVPAARTKTQLFMIVSVAAWLVGLLLAFRLNTIQSNTGNGLEFEYIIAAVVGGTLLTGGYGSAFGAAIGAFIIAMSKQGIPLARWNSDWRFAFLGVILVSAVIANSFIRTRAEASR